MREHSIAIDYFRCLGCTSCIKACPAEAIRVRNGKAKILDQRCLDCGTCIGVCRHNAIKSQSDSLDTVKRFRYTVALPDATLFSQFEHLTDVNVVLSALLSVGFDDVWEPSRAAELLSAYESSRKGAPGRPVPVISSACPSIIRLIQIRFPKLLPNVANTITPMELAAKLARREACEKTGLAPEEIGIIGIVPCSSMVTESHSPITLEKPVLDAAIGVKEVYQLLLEPVKRLGEVRPLSKAGRGGLRWSYIGGESKLQSEEDYLPVDGIENCIRTLEEIESGRIPEAKYIEMSACVHGCVGGSLCVRNPYAANLTLRKIMKAMPASELRTDLSQEEIAEMTAEKPIEYRDTLVLDTDRAKALEKMVAIGQLTARLPGLDCGSCGAPACHAFAEDVVMGKANEEDCFFKVKARLQKDGELEDPSAYLPAPFRRRKPVKKGD